MLLSVNLLYSFQSDYWNLVSNKNRWFTVGKMVISITQYFPGTEKITMGVKLGMDNDQ